MPGLIAVFRITISDKGPWTYSEEISKIKNKTKQKNSCNPKE